MNRVSETIYLTQRHKIIDFVAFMYLSLFIIRLEIPKKGKSVSRRML